MTAMSGGGAKFHTEMGRASRANAFLVFPFPACPGSQYLYFVE